MRETHRTPLVRPVGASQPSARVIGEVGTEPPPRLELPDESGTSRVLLYRRGDEQIRWELVSS